MKRLRGWGGSTLRRLSFYCSGGRVFDPALSFCPGLTTNKLQDVLMFTFTEVGKVATCLDNILSVLSARVWGLPAGRCLSYCWAWNYRPDLNPLFYQAKRGRLLALKNISHWRKRAEFLEPLPKFPVLNHCFSRLTYQHITSKASLMTLCELYTQDM